MAATVQIHALTGVSPGTSADVTNTTLRLKRADNHTADANDPVPIPASGYAYSWRKTLRLVATTAPSNRISNLRVFTNGTSLGQGRTVLFARSGSYVQASSADESTAIGSTDAADLTTGSPETIQAGTVITSADALPASGGALQDFFMVQMRVADNALAGAAAGSLQLSLRWDET